MTTDKIILLDSPEAATYRTDICGWVSRGGRYYYSATQVLCVECGMLTVREYPLCKTCGDKADAERYAALPRAKWDGETPLYSERNDRFYNTPEEASDDAMEAGVSVDDLWLVICEPVYATPLESDYFSDDLPDDGEIPQQILDAIYAFNEAVAGVIISWQPGKTALDLEEDA